MAAAPINAAEYRETGVDLIDENDIDDGVESRLEDHGEAATAHRTSTPSMSDSCAAQSQKTPSAEAMRLKEVDVGTIEDPHAVAAT